MHVRGKRLIRWWMVPVLSVASFAAGGDLRLVEAVKNQNWDEVPALLKQRVDVNTPQGDGATTLHWATHWDDLDTVDLLIRAGAKVNAANSLGVTPISLACTNGSAAMVKRLLTAGANPNATLSTGESRADDSRTHGQRGRGERAAGLRSEREREGDRAGADSSDVGGVTATLAGRGGAARARERTFMTDPASAGRVSIQEFRGTAPPPPRRSG